MIKTRLHPWTCSKIADYIRGSKKPYALDLDGWNKWKEKQKNERPFRYWISDSGLRYLQNFIYFPYDLYKTVKIYIRNRWIDKSHYLKTNLIPGRYYELDHRILHGLFNELVDFVEIELAHLSKYNNKKYDFRNGRCVKAAYDYFNWANNLKDTLPDGREIWSQQSEISRRIQQLYEWWKNIRPNRPEPSDISGLSKYFCDNNTIIKRNKEYLNCFEKSLKIEQEYDDEDTKMLIELVKIRHHLWT